MAQRSIIVCDDELELAHELGEFFESNGWRTLVCGSASEVEEALRAGFAPTCLLTDLRLGDGDGREILNYASRLSAAFQPTVTAMITGHAPSDAASDRFGADLLYFKPIDPFVILADVEARLARAAGPNIGAEA